ncbi:MAG: hypothetical protein B7Y41_08765 [Hydrogenophilales bacterium 28-61-23]|nr:MAG: hypothetical protein B7Y41_08765 [Hydrogenophilales bacterium 28-61-23]
MNQRCGNPNCYAHEGVSCHLGEQTPTACSAWNGAATETSDSAATEDATARVPWSGNALGLTDLATLTPRGRHILVGVLGAHDAGKTTLLLGNYLHLLRGGEIAQSQFAGSRTLAAWESLAAWTRFDDAPRIPSFPPHTPRGTGRVPGLLHLALRGQDDSHRDVFLTDAPGEWFSSWAIRADAPDAEGARWTEQNADVFLIVADCERLSGPGKGGARNSTKQLIERLHNHVGLRPVVLVWAKSDHSPPEALKKAIRDTLTRCIPLAQEIDVTATRPESLEAALSLALRSVWQPQLATPIQEPVTHTSPYFAFRSRHA